MEPTKIFASPCQRAGALEAEGRGRHGHELLLVVADLGRNQLDRARLLLFFFLFVIIKVIPSLSGPVPRTSGGRDDVEELVEDDLGGLDELHVVGLNSLASELSEDEAEMTGAAAPAPGPAYP